MKLGPFALAFVLLNPILILNPTHAYSLPFVEGKARAAYANIPNKETGKTSGTGWLGAVGRYGYRSDDSDFYFALDITAFRLMKGGDLNTNIDGNTARLAVGYDWQSLSTWVSGGAGELRSYDRSENKSKPYRYYAREMEIGFSYDFYRSEEARVTFGTSWNRLLPDTEWQERYKLSYIDSLQFEIGFKLLNW